MARKIVILGNKILSCRLGLWNLCWLMDVTFLKTTTIFGSKSLTNNLDRMIRWQMLQLKTFTIYVFKQNKFSKILTKKV